MQCANGSLVPTAGAADKTTSCEVDGCSRAGMMTSLQTLRTNRKVKTIVGGTREECTSTSYASLNPADGISCERTFGNAVDALSTDIKNNP